ncbi:cadherin-like domain-containing protein, partial [Bradyrhizobium sp. LHD-71]|uniref:cadherin-like domain-containing protein n=1 Tax=Bradyrhizobium sp. LHD-71 TaxID=3072141 RepID=UPI00280DAB51
MSVTEVSNLGLALSGLGSHSPNIAIDSDSSNDTLADAVVVSDADLLFTGEFRRSGSDLMISKDDRRIVIDDYFKSETRTALATRDGAVLSADVVQALSGEVQYAQAAPLASAGAVIGRVSKLTGFATAVRNGVSVQLNLGDNVQKGDVVQTGAGSSLGLVFIDGTVFGLAANARMVLTEMIYDRAGSSNSSLLSLVQGTITFVAGETAKRGDMRVETPAATMGIRGTAVLVEIEFVVPGAGAAPSVRVQVLSEPGGVTGSLVLFSRSSPNTPIGQVSQAGLVTSITGTGDVSTQPAPPLSLAAQAIVDQTLREYFPNYRPGGSSTPPGSPDDRLQPDPINFPVDSPTILPLKVNLTTQDLPTDDIPIRVTRFNTPPDVSVNDLTVVVNNVGANPAFNIAERVNIVDPDAGNDVQVLYVADTARLIGVTGPPSVPATMDLARLINIDPQTGTVSYDPASFAFLAQGASVGYMIAFDSRSGPDTVHRTLLVTIVGVNDAPVVTSASLAMDEGASVLLTASSIGITDPDATSFTVAASNISNGRFEIFSGESWVSTTTFTSADIAAGHIRFTHNGSESAPTFSVQVHDGLDTSSTFDATIAFNGVNDAPVITSASLAVDEGISVALTASSIGIVDPDTTNFTVAASNISNGQFEIFSGGSWVSATTFTSAEVAAGHIRFTHNGSESAPTFSVQVSDGFDTSNTFDATIAFNAVNDPPVAVADTNWV